MDTPKRIVAISDTHGMHRQLIVPEGDVLIHAGDLTAYGKLHEVADFNEWIGSLPHKTKIIIAGNHDWCFEGNDRNCRELLSNCIYLRDESVVVDGIKYYGSPWQPKFNNWAFNLSTKKRAKKWSEIPADTDVLITHGPPFGGMDLTEDGLPVGCKELSKVVNRIKPKVHVFGHIHECYGQTAYGVTRYVNASSCNARYQVVNKPLVFEVR
jgi:Icc-related predicted phosphoesterase